MSQAKLQLETDRYIGRYLGFTDISIWAKTASVGVDKTLLYSPCMQTTCARKCNEPRQDSYLAATLAGVFSSTNR